MPKVSFADMPDDMLATGRVGVLVVVDVATDARRLERRRAVLLCHRIETPSLMIASDAARAAIWHIGDSRPTAAIAAGAAISGVRPKQTKSARGIMRLDALAARSRRDAAMKSTIRHAMRNARNVDRPDIAVGDGRPRGNSRPKAGNGRNHCHENHRRRNAEARDDNRHVDAKAIDNQYRAPVPVPVVSIMRLFQPVACWCPASSESVTVTQREKRLKMKIERCATMTSRLILEVEMRTARNA